MNAGRRWWIVLAAIATGCASEPLGSAVFRDATELAGLDFVHDAGATGERYIAEIMGPGGALFDFDNDGDLDIYLVQGGRLGAGEVDRDRLYRNDSGRSELRFTDVTEASGVGVTEYGMGVVAGDYDNDGWTDLYVTNFGSNRLLRNLGDGRFRDETEGAGVNDRRFSVPAVFFDYDLDGLLDLYVGNYVDFRLATHKQCLSPSGVRDYCGPLAYDPQPDRLFRNRGDGTFEDVTGRAGLRGAPGNALGAVALDADHDGRPDLYVANDTGENQLWMGRGDGTFADAGLLAGCAVNASGQPEGSMGVDAGDVDGDGDEDLLMTHMTEETNTFYVNDGRGHFEDATIASGLGAPSWEFTGFGMAWIDYDNDGRLDALVVNGDVNEIEALRERGDPYPLHQTNQLYRNTGAGRFEEVTRSAGDVFALSEVSRGLAVGDVDNDGDVDALVINNNGPARLLVNQVGARQAWLGLRMIGQRVGRDMHGCRVGVFREGRPALWRTVRTARSYASSSDPRLLFGLGDHAEIQKIQAIWPGGRVEEWRGLEVGRYHTLREGTGEPGA